jgi:DNA polymerase III subunit gamma/tau
MSQYIVSARKYRPQTFTDVVGQGHISKTLKNALKSGQLAHAFLFCGPRGVGKTTIARILARAINCLASKEDFEPCGECNSCQSIKDNASFNIFELDAASNNSVEDIRYLNEQVRIAPHQGKYKVFIIDEVHMLSQAAFNAFLKTLEEPPPYAIFILATTEKHKIIPTILSRCQIYDFRRISNADIALHLSKICAMENIQADKEAISIIAERADGALRDALSIFDRMISSTESDKYLSYDLVVENLHVLDTKFYSQFTEQILLGDVGKLLEMFNDTVYRGFDPEVFVGGLMGHFRNLLVANHTQVDKLLEVSDAMKQKLMEQAQVIPYDLLVSWLDIGNELDIHYKMARNKLLHVEMGLVRIVYAGLKTIKSISLSFEEESKKKTSLNS